MGELFVIKEISVVEVEELRKVLLDYERAMLKLVGLSGKGSWLSERKGHVLQIANAQGAGMLTEARGAIGEALEVYLQHFKPVTEDQMNQSCSAGLVLKPEGLNNTIKSITSVINDSIPRGVESQEVLRLLFQLRIARLDQIRTNLMNSAKRS